MSKAPLDVFTRDNLSSVDQMVMVLIIAGRIENCENSALQFDKELHSVLRTIRPNI